MTYTYTCYDIIILASDPILNEQLKIETILQSKVVVGASRFFKKVCHLATFL